MLLTPWLESAWPWSATVLFWAGDTPVPASSLFILLAVMLLALLAFRLTSWAVDRRLARSERLGTLGRRVVREVVRWPFVLLGLAVGFDLSGLGRATRVLEVSYDLFYFELLRVAGTPVTPATVLSAGLVLLATWWVSSLAQRLVRRGFQSDLLKGKDDGTVGVVERLVHYVVLGIGATIALEAVGLDLSALFAAGAVFAVGIGFAMQNIAQNFVSGLILLIERVIKPGDVLEVDGRVVRVERLGIRSTVVRSLDDEDLIVPNSALAQGTVKNLTMTDSLLRLRAPVGVVYGADMKRVMEALRDVAERFEGRHPDKDPVVLLTGFGSSSVDFEVSVWIDDPWKAQTARSRLRQAIWWAFKDADIVIAFPQVDVHFDPPVEDALKFAARRTRPARAG